MKETTHDDVLRYLSTAPKGITFIHGKAGSGKTTLIRKLESGMSGCQILAPTNFAADLYRGARTIHSFFYAALDGLDDNLHQVVAGVSATADVTLCHSPQGAGEEVNELSELFFHILFV